MLNSPATSTDNRLRVVILELFGKVGGSKNPQVLKPRPVLPTRPVKVKDLRNTENLRKVKKRRRETAESQALAGPLPTRQALSPVGQTGPVVTPTIQTKPVRSAPSPVRQTSPAGPTNSSATSPPGIVSGAPTKPATSPVGAPPTKPAIGPIKIEKPDKLPSSSLPIKIEKPEKAEEYRASLTGQGKLTIKMVKRPHLPDENKPKRVKRVKLTLGGQAFGLDK